MPVAFISTRTSPAFGPSRSSSTISSGFFASNETAARVFICHISLKNSACPAVAVFEFLVALQLPACRLIGRGHNVDYENPDEHPSCSRALHSRAERQGWRCQTYLFFLSNASLVEDSECRICVLTISLRGIRTKYAVSRRENRVSCSVLRTPNRSRAVAQPCRSRYQRQPQLRYNIHAGPGAGHNSGRNGMRRVGARFLFLLPVSVGLSPGTECALAQSAPSNVQALPPIVVSRTTPNVK